MSDPTLGILSEETGFQPDGRVVVVATTLINTFVVVDGMYPPNASEEEIIATERENALDDPAAFIEDAEVFVHVSVIRAEVQQ